MANEARALAHLIDVESAPAINLLGPALQFLIGPDATESPCIMRGTIPPGMVVPLHSHADPETFFMVSGELEGLSYDATDLRWITIAPGGIFNVPSNAKHAFRNNGREPAVTIIVSTSRIGRFFQEIGVPVVPGTPTQTMPSSQQIQRFLETSARYGYWNASPEENARIGIVVAV